MPKGYTMTLEPQCACCGKPRYVAHYDGGCICTMEKPKQDPKKSNPMLDERDKMVNHLRQLPDNLLKLMGYTHADAFKNGWDAAMDFRDKDMLKP